MPKKPLRFKVISSVPLKKIETSKFQLQISQNYFELILTISLAKTIN